MKKVYYVGTVKFYKTFCEHYLKVHKLSPDEVEIIFVKDPYGYKIKSIDDIHLSSGANRHVKLYQKLIEYSGAV